MSQEIKVQKSTVKKLGIFVALIAIVLIGFFSVKNFASAEQVTGNSVNTLPSEPGQVQNVKVTMSGNQYILEPSELKKDIPVRMEVDLSKVNGCYRSIVIPAFGVRKGVRSNDNIIEFTPTKSGTFGITCAMGMGQGNFKVLDSSGVPSTYIDTSAQQKGSSGSCGTNGCGCGGF